MESETRLCKCGCGGTPNEGKVFIQGHHNRYFAEIKKANLPPPPLCACGCGEPASRGKHFKHGHYLRSISGEEQARRKRGWKMPEDQRERQSELMKGFIYGPREQVDDPEKCGFCECGCGNRVRKAGNRFLFGHRSHTEEFRRIASATASMKKGTKIPEQGRARMREAKRRWFDEQAEAWNDALSGELDPETVAKHLGVFDTAERNFEFAFPTTCSRPECIIQIALIQRGIFPFLVNVPIRTICRPDITLPYAGIVIQIDGIYWHRGRKDKDAAQDAALRKCDWIVFRWTEEDVQKRLPELMEELEAAYVSRLCSCEDSALSDGAVPSDR